MDLQVAVSDWELGCCGGPLRLGDRIRWRLLFSLDDAAPDVVWTATPVAGRSPGWSSRVLDSDGVHAGWSTEGTPQPTGVVGLRGRLTATWHGGDGWEDLPPIDGRIARIQVVSRLHQEGTATPDGSWTRFGGHDGRTFVTVPGSEEFRDVDTAPDGSEDDAPTPRRDQTSYRAESGWLVDLRLDR